MAPALPGMILIYEFCQQPPETPVGGFPANINREIGLYNIKRGTRELRLFGESLRAKGVINRRHYLATPAQFIMHRVNGD